MEHICINLVVFMVNILRLAKTMQDTMGRCMELVCNIYCDLCGKCLKSASNLARHILEEHGTYLQRSCGLRVKYSKTG